MNFKPVVASLIALGLSMPVWAADEATNNQDKHHEKHQAHHDKHHGKHHAKHHEKHHATRHEHETQGAAAVVMQPVNQYERQEHFMVVNNAQSPVSTFDWANRFHFSGEVNVDFRYANPGPLGIVPHPLFRSNSSAYGLNVNNVNLYVDVDVNRCVAAHVGIAYVADGVNLYDLGLNTSLDAEDFADAIRSDKHAVWSSGRLGLDEAYITIRDFAESSFYFRAGKMYVSFGYNPDPYPLSYSYTQLLTQTRATAAELGFASCGGFYGSLFVLDGAISSHSDDFLFAARAAREAQEARIAALAIAEHEAAEAAAAAAANQNADDEFDEEGVGRNKVNRCEDGDEGCGNAPRPAPVVPTLREVENRGLFGGDHLNNWGAKVGYSGCCCGWEFALNASYLQDIRDTDYLSSWLEITRAALFVAGDDEFGILGLRKTGAVDVHADTTYAGFGLSADYVQATHDLYANDNNQFVDVNGNPVNGSKTEIAAFDITGTYNTCFFGYNTGFAISYQKSWDAFPFLPEWRLQGDIGFNIFPNTTLTFEYRYDKNYGSDDVIFVGTNGAGTTFVANGLDTSTSTAAIRLGVVF